MDFHPRTVLWLRLALVGLVLFILSAPTNAWSEGLSLDSVGVRLGNGSNHSSKDFHEAEAFSDLNLPWEWNLGSKFHLDTRLDVGMGWLGERSTQAVVGEAGPLLILTYKQFPVTLGFGSNATGLSRSEFETKDMGILFQFTTHVGAYWDFAPHFRVGYRYQHTSNCALSGSNPGLNMHMLGLSYVF